MVEYMQTYFLFMVEAMSEEMLLLVYTSIVISMNL